MHPLTALVSPNFAVCARRDGGVRRCGVGCERADLCQGVQGDALSDRRDDPWTSRRHGRAAARQLVTLRTDVTLGVAFNQPERSVEARVRAGSTLVLAATDGYRRARDPQRALLRVLRSRSARPDLQGTPRTR